MKELLEQLGFKDEQGVYLPMLSEFVWKVLSVDYTTNELGQIETYTHFIIQPLKKEMFVPCDEEGVVLSKPIIKLSEGATAKERQEKGIYKDFAQKTTEYQQALQKVLFEGWRVESQVRNRTSIYTEEQDLIFYFKGQDPLQLILESRVGYPTTIEQSINNGVKLYLK